MAEATWTSCHSAKLKTNKGRGLVLLGLDITPAATADFITTGLTEISGVGWAMEDAALDIASAFIVGAISGGTLTIYNAKISDTATDASGPMRLLIMGVVR